jgi:sec-independent protein translocase protein TatA
MPNIGPMELIILLVVVLLLFGSTRLPKLARSMGEASREFKKGVSDGAKAEPAELAPERDEKVTMSKAEYDALLAERDAKARKDAPPAV